MLPSVVIIGRPNVGKSTLFNRLTGRRSALVSDTPGLTRDRREGEAEIGGHPITLIDTAGLEDAPSGSIAARMRAQTETAVRETDVVLFVVDARAGVTPPDVEFARLARTTGKPVVLVANKSEGRAGAEGFYDAFQLGFGAPVAVSAEHGEGLADLESDILSALGLQAKISKRRKGDVDQSVTEEAPREASHPLRIAIVGRPNAGKSTLVNTILGQERMITGPEPGLTRDAVATDLDWQGHRMRLFDTAGLRRKARISETAEKLSASDAVRAIRFAEVVVLLIDAERPFEHQDLTIGDLVTEEGRALVVAVNKWDVVENKQKLLRELKSTVAEKLSQVPDVALVPVSALSGRGVDKLMEAVIKAHAIWNTRVSTSDLNRWLREAMERHTPPAAKGRRIRIRFITQPSTRPPTFVAFCSQPAGLPKSYVRYLVNSLRDAFGLPGVPIRFSLRKGENPYVRS